MSEPVYTILSRVHVNQWDNDRQTAVAGWSIQAKWRATGTVLPVFILDDAYTADNVDRAIRAAGARDEAVHALGR